MVINVKQEFLNLDRNNFEDVCDLVDRIMEDIWVTAVDDDSLQGLMKDYMVDLINPDQQLFALKKKFGTNLDWIKIKVPMTYYEVEKYFGPQCGEYEPLCSCCNAWKEFHLNNHVVTVYLERTDIIKCLDEEIDE